MHGRTRIWMALASLAILGCAGMSQTGDPVARMAAEDLKARLGEPGLTILDVRAPGDWEGSDRMVKGAVRENPTATAEWAPKYAKGDTLVLYCA